MKQFEARQMWRTLTLAGSFMTLLVLGACSQAPKLATAAHDDATHVSTVAELRAAVADPAIDAIFVEAGTYFIPAAFYEVALTVNRDLTITGAGQEATLLQAGVVEEGYESYEYDTLLEVLSGTVLVSDMTIRPSGPCIRNNGTLTLTRVKVSGCGGFEDAVNKEPRRKRTGYLVEQASLLHVMQLLVLLALLLNIRGDHSFITMLAYGTRKVAV